MTSARPDRDAVTDHIEWQNATILCIVERTRTIRSFFLQLSRPFGFTAGQHVDLRLTAEDGYAAMRSYSIASSPTSSGIIELAIERLPDGEVSTFFHDVARVGDEIELRGPLGGHFLWPAHTTQPILMIGAGSGLVPLMSMIRQRSSSSRPVPTALLLSSRTWSEVLFRDELLAAERDGSGLSVALALTRDETTRSGDFARHVDGAMIADVLRRLPAVPSHVFLCGSNAFVNVATDGALDAGLSSATIKTERYGG